MPSAEDKVVLQISLEIQDAMDRLKKVEKRIEKIKKTSESVSPGSAESKQEATSKKLLQAAKERRAAAEAISAATRAQTAELAKQDRLITRIAKKAKEMAEAFGKKHGQVTGGGLAAAGGNIARGAVGAPMSLMGALYGFTMGGLKSGYAMHQQHEASKFGLTGLGARGGMRGRAGKGLKLGFGVPETMQQAAMVAKQTGSAGAVSLAQQFAFAGGFGSDVGGAAQTMGGLREAGIKFGLGRNYRGKPGGAAYNQDRRADERIRAGGERTMREMVAAGMYSGLEKAKLPEFYQSVSSIAEDVSHRQFGAADVRGISGMLAMFSKGLGISSQRARAVMGGIDQGIRAPGAGEAGQALIMQAFGFGKPGGQTGFYDALKMQQRGLFGGEKGSGAGRMQMVFDEINKQYGTVGAGGTGKDQQAANSAISQVMPQLTLDQIEKIQEQINSGKSMEDRMKSINKIMEESKPIDQQALAASVEGFAGMKKYLEGIDAKSARIGSKAAGIFKFMQKTQMKTLDWLTDGIPTLIGYIKEIRDVVVGWFDQQTGGAQFGAIGKETQKVYKAFEGTRFSSIADEIKERRKSLSTQATSTIGVPTNILKSLMKQIKEDGGISASNIIGGIAGEFFGGKKKMTESMKKTFEKIIEAQKYLNRVESIVKMVKKSGVEGIHPSVMKDIEQAAKANKTWDLKDYDKARKKSIKMKETLEPKREGPLPKPDDPAWNDATSAISDTSDKRTRVVRVETLNLRGSPGARTSAGASGTAVP